MITQAQFQLLSGSDSLNCLDVGDFELVVSIMEQRLLNTLCLTAVPVVQVDDTEETDPLWLQLLSDALLVSVQVKQNDGIKSESMRNYSYTFQDWANSWMALSMKSGDLLNKFNACSSGITMQRDVASQIYGLTYLDEYDECI